MERRPQLCQRIERRISPRAFVNLEHGFASDSLALGIELSGADCQRYNLVLEPASLYGRYSLLVTRKCKCVGFFTRDSVFAREVLSGQAHIEIVVGPFVDEARIGPDVMAAHRNQAHGLGAARDYAVSPAGPDPLGCKGNRLQAGGAETIDRHSRGLFRNPGKPRGLASDIHPGFGLGRCATHYAILDHRGLQARRALDGRLDYRRSHIIWPRVFKAPLRRLAYRCS